MHDFIPGSRVAPHELDSTIPEDVRRARTVCVLFALLGCVPVLFFIHFNISIVPIVFIVFGVQVALAPTAIFALYFTDHARLSARPTIVATISGFFCGIVFGVLATSGVFGEWWKNYGVFLTPVIALSIPSGVIVSLLIARERGIKSSASFLRLLLMPLPKPRSPRTAEPRSIP